MLRLSVEVDGFDMPARAVAANAVPIEVARVVAESFAKSCLTAHTRSRRDRVDVRVR